MEPKEIVLAAYQAANNGQYAKANGCLSPEFRKELTRTQSLGVAAGRSLRRNLLKPESRRSDAAAHCRKMLREISECMKTIADMKLGSAKSLKALWNMATRNRNLVKIEATRQVIRNSRARVYLRLTLRDGSVVKDSEPLVFLRGKWFLG